MSIASLLDDCGISDVDLATAVGVSREAVRQWRHGIRKIGPMTAIKVEVITGIPRHELRPDLWQQPERMSA